MARPFAFLIAISLAVAASAASVDSIDAFNRFEQKIISPFQNKSGFAAIRAYGRLLNEESVVGGHSTDTRVFSFDGLTVRGFLDNSGHFFLQRVIVTKPDFEFTDGLRLGFPLARFVQCLGAPREQSATQAVFQAEADTITLHLKDSVVVSVEIDVYTG